MQMRRAIALGCLILTVASSACGLPQLEDAEPKQLAQTSFLYAADGSLITELHAGEDRVVLGYAQMPQSIKDAVVAIEDQRFWYHHGVDGRALLRAAYIDVRAGGYVEGGSTITQQLVKNLYVGNDVTLARKIDEAALAWQLEEKLSKEQILAKYLNTVYFGQGAYGVQAAARQFFDEDAKDLGLAQAATLAGSIRAPNTFDPAQYPKRALRRRGEVLDAMMSQGLIDQAARDRAASQAIRLRSPDEEITYDDAYFVDYFMEWFLSNPKFGEERPDREDLLFNGGLRITTTVDPQLQIYADRAVNSVLTYNNDPYGAMTVIDPRNGYVRAMVGGRDFWDERSEFAKLSLVFPCARTRAKPAFAQKSLKGPLTRLAGAPADGVSSVAFSSTSSAWPSSSSWSSRSTGWSRPRSSRGTTSSATRHTGSRPARRSTASATRSAAPTSGTTSRTA